MNKNNENTFVKKSVVISAIVFVLLIIFAVIAVVTWPNRTLNSIERQVKRQNYQRAEELIEAYEKQYDDVDLAEYKKECSYNIAIASISDEDTEDARYRLLELGDYLQAKELLKECDYIDACALFENGEYEQSYAKFASLSGYKDTDDKMISLKYAIAEKTHLEGQKAKALELYIELGDYIDSKEKAESLSMEVTGADSIEEAYKILEGMNVEQMQKIALLTEARKALPNNVLAVGAHHTVGLKYDGSVLATGLNDDGQCDVSAWSNIIAVDAGSYHTIGLTADGKVLAAGSNEYGQCDVDDIENAVDIAAGAYNTYVLLKDGSIVSVGFSYIESLSDLSDIKHIGAGSYAAAFIDGDGTIFASHPSLYINETGAIDVDVSTGYTAVLMPDGSVVSQVEQLSSWEDIIAISASSNSVLAIKPDGNIETHFFSSRDFVDLSGYNNVIAVAAGGAHNAMLLDDGSVVAFGKNADGQCDVDDWSLIELVEDTEEVSE